MTSHTVSRTNVLRGGKPNYDSVTVALCEKALAAKQVSTNLVIDCAGRAMSVLLAVDLGVKTGLALYGQDGRLLWYRSHNFGTAERLRRGMRGVLDTLPDLAWLVLEGGGPLADLWLRAARQRSIPVRQISAEAWRRQLLYAREQRSGAQAKDSATALARRVITWSGTRRPTSLRDDAAEAILIGLWGALEIGWLAQLPEAVRH